MTHLLYLDDAYLRSTEGRVVAREDGAVAMDRTVFYPTGGGQPHDTGELRWNDGRAGVTAVRKDGDVVWHVLDAPGPAVGEVVTQEIDWERRHQLMRTHTALHLLCGVIWQEWEVPVTGASMEPLAARMDFEFGPLPEGFKEQVAARVNAEVAADRPIHVSFLPRDKAALDPALVRTKTNLVPDSVREVRVVDIEGLDRQADGGTHVRSTAEVGRIEIDKTESKGRGNKRVRLRVRDA